MSGRGSSRKPDAVFARLAAHREAWTGSSYEVRMDLPRLGFAARRSLLRRLWKHSALDGPYLRAGSTAIDAPPSWRRVDLNQIAPPGTLWGRATLPGGEQTTFSSYMFSYEEETWLYFGLPLGALNAFTSIPVGAYPFDDGLPLDWRADLDAWLCVLARWVHAVHPVRLALVGWPDAEQDLMAAQIAAEGVPAVRWVGLLVPGPEGGLDWHSATQGSPIW